MTCNGYGHPLGCGCGFGGDTGNGPPVAGSVIPRLRGLSETRPNAQCPVCGATVFFYAAPNGGRVYFDELGPPWPKHPCMDEPTDLDPLPRSVLPRA